MKHLVSLQGKAILMLLEEIVNNVKDYVGTSFSEC